MAMFDQADATNILKAILNNVAYTTVTATNILLGTSAPTATGNMTQLGGGTGYTTGGSTIAWNTVVNATTSNSGTVSWTNSGSTWTLVGLEIWNSAVTVRHLFGTWTSQPISVLNGNTFQVAPAGISVSLV
jgi:hypothetical protein